MAQTERELELLVKIAAREQRYACIEVLPQEWHGAEAMRIQNTPCPDVSAVLKEWRAELAKGGEAQ